MEEKILYKGKRDSKLNILLALGLALFGGLMFVDNLFMIPLIALIVWCIYVVTTEYRITDKRIMHKTLFFTHQFPANDLVSVMGAQQGRISIIFDYVNIFFISKEHNGTMGNLAFTQIGLNELEKIQKAVQEMAKLNNKEVKDHGN